MSSISTNPKVSIVVPVYNVEKYLARCVDSLLVQTLVDIEIILVDDGSLDECPTICDSYSVVDSRVRVVHQSNAGLAGARASGQKVATGEYIGFVDSDDYIDCDMFERLYIAACENDADFVMCDYVRETQNGCRNTTKYIPVGLYDKERIIEVLYPQLIMKEEIDFGPVLSVWCCMYRRSFLERNGLKFDPKVRLSEDCLFNACAVLYAERFYYLKGFCPYHYVENTVSLSHGYKSFAWESFCHMNDVLRGIFGDERITGYDFSRQLDLHMAYFTSNMLGRIGHKEASFIEKYFEIKQVISDSHVKIAMKGFVIPKGIVLGFSLQIWFVKHGCAIVLALW